MSVGLDNVVNNRDLSVEFLHALYRAGCGGLHEHTPSSSEHVLTCLAGATFLDMPSKENVGLALYVK